MQNEIPKILQNPDFYFILVQEKDKKPIENYWQCTTLKSAVEKWEAEKSDEEKRGKPFKKEKPIRHTQYKFDDPILTEHIKKGGNYGIVCGVGGLIVVDIDKPMEDVVMPETLQVMTPSNGSHYYFICPELKKKIILEYEGVHYGEIQAGCNTQIICPGCIAKSKVTGELKSYNIKSKNNQIIEISFNGIKDLLGKYFKSQPQTQNGKTLYIDNKFTLGIDRVISLSKYKQRGSEYQGVHPVHGSEGGSNFCVNVSKNTWHCFRHDCGGGPLELIGQIEGIINCGDNIRGDKFNLILKIATEKYGLIQNKPVTPTDLKLTVMQFLAQDKTDEASETIVRDILDRHHIYTIRDDKTPEIWIYCDGIYTPHGKTYILEECRNILENAYTIQLSNLVVQKIMTDTFIDVNDFFKERNDDWVCVKNGLLNPITKELKDFSPDNIHFTKLPVEYKPDAQCPIIQNHFKEITNDESDVRVLEEITGWFLTNEYKPERAIMLSGTGRNGKGKTILLWKDFLGVDNISTIALHQFEQDQYAAGDLMSKRANLAGDIDSTTLKNTALFKQVTGRDPISSNRKYLSRVKFNNNAKMVCAANELPHSRDLSIGFFSRWILVDFPFRFLSRQEIDSVSEEERSICKLADMDIINKLTTPEELSGLLNLAIVGFQRLIKNGDFSTSRTTDDVKMEWIKRSDSFGSFVIENLDEEYDSYITKRELRQRYSKYCKDNKLRIANDKLIKDKMSELMGSYETKKEVGGERLMVWCDIKFKNNVQCGGVDVQGVQGVQGIPKSKSTRKGYFYEMAGQAGQAGQLALEKEEHQEQCNNNNNINNMQSPSIMTEFLEEVQRGTPKDVLMELFGENYEPLVKEAKNKGLIYETPDGDFRVVEK